MGGFRTKKKGLQGKKERMGFYSTKILPDIPPSASEGIVYFFTTIL